MRLACKARALHVPRETPSLPRTSDSSFSLKDSSTYTIHPIVLSLDSLSTSSPHIQILTNPLGRIAGLIFPQCLRRQDQRLHSMATRLRHNRRTPQDLVLEAHQQNLRDLANLKTIRHLRTLETSLTYTPRLNRSLVRLLASY